MATVVLGGPELDRLLEDRRRRDVDHWDEVWEGVLHVVPPPLDEHQRVTTGLGRICWEVVVERDLGEVRVQGKVSEKGYEHYNYRVPDVAVALKRGRARIAKQGIAGGPDFLVEVLSPGDETYEKFPYYASLGVRELLIVEPDSKRVELYRRKAGKLILVAKSPETAPSRVLPLEFERIAKPRRSRLQVTDTKTGQKWTL